MRALVPVSSRGDLALSELFGRAPAFALVEIEGSSHKVLEIVENPFAEAEHAKRAQGIYQLISAKKPDVIITSHIGPGIFYRLRRDGIKIYYAAPGLRIDELVELLRKGALEEAKEPREPEGHHH